MDKRTTRLCGVLGVAVVIAAVLWPGRTAYAAVELIGLWSVLSACLNSISQDLPAMCEGACTPNRCRDCFDRDWRGYDEVGIYRRSAGQCNRWYCGYSSRNKPDLQWFYRTIPPD